MIYLPNGDIRWEDILDPPSNLAGYKQDPDDPWLFHPDFVPCRHRRYTPQMCPANPRKVNPLWICLQLKGNRTDQLGCAACKLPK